MCNPIVSPTAACVNSRFGRLTQLHENPLALEAATEANPLFGIDLGDIDPGDVFDEL